MSSVRWPPPNSCSCARSPDPGGAPFRLYADKPATFALSGELDKSCTDLFATTVERVLPVMEPADEMVIDETGLTFVDHRALLTLDHHLGRLGVQGLLRTPCSTATRLAELLGLSCLRVEQVPVQSASGGRDGRVGRVVWCWTETGRAAR